MIESFKLAGLFAAHSLHDVSEGETFVPLLVYTTSPDECTIARLTVSEDLETCVVHGKEKLESNDMGAMDAVLLYDGHLQIDKETVDAVIIEMRSYTSLDAKAVLAIPYTPKKSGRFLVYRPKVIRWENCDDFNLDSVIQSFFEAFKKHEKGAKILRDHVEKSK